MTILYSKLARIYHEMYQSIFDYKKEFKTYDEILKNYKCKKVLEIACGSGNLATYFLNAGYDYLGLDLSKNMLKIARQTEPRAKFVIGDMRNLNLKEKFDTILISGRSFTYLSQNKDIMNTLKSVNKCLKKQGIFIFDNLDAEYIFTHFNKRFIQTARYKDKKYKRISKNSWNLETGWTWNWNSTYYIKEKGRTRIFKDKSLLRAFTQDEIKLFLEINNFKVLKVIKQKMSFITIAKRIN